MLQSSPDVDTNVLIVCSAATDPTPAFNSCRDSHARILVCTPLERSWPLPQWVDSHDLIEAETSDEAVRRALAELDGQPVFFLWGDSGLRAGQAHVNQGGEATPEAVTSVIVGRGLEQSVCVFPCVQGRAPWEKETPTISLKHRFGYEPDAIDLMQDPDFFLTHLNGVYVPDASLVRWGELDSQLRGLNAVTTLLIRNESRLPVRFLSDYEVFESYSDAHAQQWQEPTLIRFLAGEVIPRWRHLNNASEGRAQSWVEHLIVYLMDRCAQDYDALAPETGRSTQTTRNEIAECLNQVCQQIPSTAIMGYQASALSRSRRMAIAAPGYVARGETLPPQPLLWARRAFHPLRKVSFFALVDSVLGDTQPDTWVTQGCVTGGQHRKITRHGHFNHSNVCEVLSWIDEETSALRLNGVEYPVSTRVQPYTAPIPVSQHHHAPSTTPSFPSARAFVAKALRRVGGRLQKRQSTAVSTNTPDEVSLWLYMDRAHSAGDNAEPFYRYAVVEAPQIRHIFALQKNSPDWQRLQAENFELVDVDSADFEYLWRRANTLLLSDIGDPAVYRRLNDGRTRGDQRVVFLQHGYSMPSTFRWMNGKRFDVLVTCDEIERQGIIRDGSGFTLTAPEVWATGFPRHDILYRLLAESSDAGLSVDNQSKPEAVLIAPTWDYKLSQELVEATEEEAKLQLDTFFQPWLRIADCACASGYEPLLFIHPKLAQSAQGWRQQPGIKTVTGREVPQALIRSAYVVTDRSSIMMDGVLAGAEGIIWAASGDIRSLSMYQDLSSYSVHMAESLPALGELLRHGQKAQQQRQEIRLDGLASERLLNCLLGRNGTYSVLS